MYHKHCREFESPWTPRLTLDPRQDPALSFSCTALMPWIIIGFKLYYVQLHLPRAKRRLVAHLHSTWSPTLTGLMSFCFTSMHSNPTGSRSMHNASQIPSIMIPTPMPYVQYSNLKFLIQPMPNYNFAFIKLSLLVSHNDCRMSVPVGVNMYTVFSKAHLVQCSNHFELLGGQG